MRGSIFDYVGNLDTLIAVIVGACLATGGALVAEIIQDRLGRKRRARDAARFFGEILLSINQIFDLAVDSQKIGDPWGAYTLSIFRTVNKEAETYYRNRERLFDIADMKMRFALHGHLLSLTVPIQSVVEQSEAIEKLRMQLDENDALSEKTAQTLRVRMEALISLRDGSLAGAARQRALSTELLSKLEALAGTAFDASYR